MGLFRYRRVGTTTKTSVVAAIALTVALVPSVHVSSSPDRGDTKPRAVGRGLEVNTSHLSGNQAEPALAVAPRDPRRIVTTGIDFGEGDDEGYAFPRRNNIYVSSDRGGSWTALESPLQGDLTVVADHEGTFWVLGLGKSDPTQALGLPIQVARISPGESSVAGTTLLPPPPTGIGHDKPLLAIDNSPSSPTYGRLYAVWDEMGSNGYLGLFLTYCDTRAEGAYVPERCDAAENWATPFQVVQGGGWIWAPDVATGPDGEVYVVWVDVFTFAVRGAMCTATCTDPTAFTGHDIITRSTTSDSNCVPAGGRLRQTPALEVDISRGPNRGRVYVAWLARRSSDVPAVGCRFGTEQSLDIYVASEAGSLPGPTSEASLLYDDGERDSEGGSGAALSDEFYPNVSVDERTGRTWVSFYSTRLDESRKTTNVYVRELNRKGDGIGLAPSTRVSSSIDLSEGDSLGFYYGDYAGLDVVGGWPYPVWVGNGLGKDVFTWVPKGGRAL